MILSDVAGTSDQKFPPIIMCGTSLVDRSRHKGPVIPLHTGTEGIIPLPNVTVFTFAIIFSLLFILALSCAFLGDDQDEPYFKSMLNGLELSDPGVALLGENVDVDIDEPSITVTWSIVACGDTFELNNSSGIHRSTCGLPSMYLQFYVDNSPDPAAVYDPAMIPFIRQTGRRRSIENLVRFDSDYALDVHNARLYPFDIYFLSSTVRAVDASNASVPIRRLTTIDQATSFLVVSSDMDSYEMTPNGTQLLTRDIDLLVQRPGQARIFATFLFGISWMLTHITIGNVLLVRRLVDTTSKIKHLVSAFAILLVIPQLRNSMPDAPGLDQGALIDHIGFFPQMIISALSVLTLLSLMIMHDCDEMGDSHGIVLHLQQPPSKRPPPRPSPPPPCTPNVFSKPPAPTPPPPKPPLRPLLLGSGVRTPSISKERGESIHMGELDRGPTFPRIQPAAGSFHHRSCSSWVRSANEGPGKQPGVVYELKVPKSPTLQPLKER